jgi:branched-chain amino acid transport system ATP-binding protein
MLHNENILLRVEGLVKKFGDLKALDRLSLTVEKGKIVGLAGPNGSGKTTVINVVSGVYKPNGGAIEFDGRSIYKLPSHRIVHRGINRTFQVPRTLGRLTVLQNVRIAAIYGGRGQNKMEAAMEALETVGLADYQNTMAASLTFTQQKLLGLARALATGPKLLLIDEIAAGLSPQELQRIADMLIAIHGRGISMIVVEHLMGFIDSLTRDVVVMNAGANLFRGSIEEASGNEAVIESFLGR